MPLISRRDLGRLGIGAIVAMTALYLRNRAVADSSPIDPALLARLDPELRPVAREMLAQAAQMPAFTEANLPALRKMYESWVKPPLPGIAVEQRHVPIPGGAPDVSVYVINARPGAARPAILHTHGGGFIVGTPRADIPKLQRMAQTLDCVIVSVDYRLAPQTHWQGSVEDNYAALKWLHGHAAELGAHPDRIAVMGESAGGGHAALLAITARDRGEVPLVFQCLIYPMLDDRTGSVRAVAPPVGQLLWTAPDNRFGWRSFLGQEPGTADVPVSAVPARVPSVKGLPPTYIAVGSLDLFVDEDVAYARRLTRAGIATELHVIPGAFHGFDEIAAGTAIARRFTAARIDALRRGFVNASRNT